MRFSGQAARRGRDSSNATGVRPWLTIAVAWIIPIAFWIASLILAFASRWRFERLAIEDGPIEALQALMILAGALTAAWVAWALHRKDSRVWSLLYGCLAIGMLWLAGEEISWGQRVFELGTPELLASNLQNEANLHNLPGVGSTLHTLMSSVLWLAIGLSVVASFWSAATRARWRTELWAPSPLLIPAWLCVLSYTWVRAFDLWWRQADNVQHVVSRAQEPAELILYGGVLTFLVMVLVQVRWPDVAASRLRSDTRRQTTDY